MSPVCAKLLLVIPSSGGGVNTRRVGDDDDGSLSLESFVWCAWSEFNINPAQTFPRGYVGTSWVRNHLPVSSLGCMSSQWLVGLQESWKLSECVSLCIIVDTYETTEQMSW